VSNPAVALSPARPLAADAGKRFDWLAIAAIEWLGIGLYADGWAHVNRLPDSFWTVWHAIFYSGFAAVATVIVGATILRRPRTATWRAAIPRGYLASVVGAAIFAFGGLFDMAWHLTFGVEVGNDALLSPSHLTLALGGALLASGPLRADLYRRDRSTSLLDRLPMVLSLAAVFSLLTFFTLYADPYSPLHGAKYSSLSDDAAFRDLLSMFVFSALLVGVLLFAVRATTLPRGTLPLLLGLNAFAMLLMHSHGPPAITASLIGVAVATGVVGEVLLAALRPSAARAVALRAFATLVPATFWTLYFVAVFFLRGIGWSFTFLSGAVVLCGVVGLLLSYVAVPPAARPEGV